MRKRKNFIIFILFLVAVSLIIAYGTSCLKKCGAKIYFDNRLSKEHKSNRDLIKPKDLKNTNQSSDRMNSHNDSDLEKKSSHEESTKPSEVKSDGSILQRAEANSNMTSTNNFSNGNSQPVKQKRWVVDTPAWDEEVRQPVYVNTWWVKFSNGTIKIYYSETEAYSLYRDRPDIVDSWGNGERVPDPSGATEVVGYIHHEEVGHWE